MFTRISVSNTGNTLVASSADTSVRVWNLKIKKQIYCLFEPKSAVTSVAIRNDDLMVSGSSDSNVIIWDLNQGKSKFICKGNSGTVSVVALTFDSSRVASGDFFNENHKETMIIVWDCKSGKY
jgi:WD40 repeat protein